MHTIYIYIQMLTYGPEVVTVLECNELESTLQFLGGACNYLTPGVRHVATFLGFYCSERTPQWQDLRAGRRMCARADARLLTGT